METSLKSLETDTYLEAYQYADDWEYDYEYEDIDEDEDIDEESSSKSNFLEHFTIDLTEKQERVK